MSVLIVEQLESLLKKNWSEFIDKSQFLRRVLVDTQTIELAAKSVSNLPPRQLKIVITHLKLRECAFELWAEFTVPKEQGVVVGTHVYILKLTGELMLQESYGTFFVPENL